MPSTSDKCRGCRSFVLPLLLALAGGAALAVDLPIAGAVQAKSFRDYRTCLDTFEPFGYGLGVVVALLAVHQLDPGRRRAIPRVLCCAFAAGGAANLLKLLVVRFRPHNMPSADSVWSTFHHWFPLFGGVGGEQSFPSAHTATAVGLAAALVRLYPQGRYLFTLLAVLVGFQRVVSGVHFPSDVLIGAAVGSFIAALFLHVGLLPGWFERWETGRTLP